MKDAAELWLALDDLLMAIGDYARWNGITALTEGQAKMFCAALSSAAVIREKHQEQHGTPRFCTPERAP